MVRDVILGDKPCDMRSNFEILSRAWDALGSQWLLAIGLCVLHGAVNLVLGSVGFGLGSLVAGGALTFGFNRAMVLIYRGHVPRVETYFDGFKHFLPTLFVFLLLGVIVFIGSILLVCHKRLAVQARFGMRTRKSVALPLPPSARATAWVT